VKRSAIRWVGRCRSSLNSVTITGVSAAAIGVPAVQNRAVTIAAIADAALAMASVRIDRRLSPPRLRACEDIDQTA